MELMARCERCGALVEASSRKRGDGTITYYTPCAVVTQVSSNDVPVRDGCEYMVLCPDCVGQLNEWLAEAPEDKKGQVDESAGEDSIERLTADMARAFACTPEDCCSIKIACEYFGHGDNIGCRDRELSRYSDECPASGYLSDGCWETMRANIRKRCKALGIDLKDGEQ